MRLPTQPNGDPAAPTRSPRGSIPPDALPPPPMVAMSDRTIEEIAAELRRLIGDDAGGKPPPSWSKGSQVTISIGVITAVVAFVGLVISVGALVWNLSAEIEKKATKRDVLQFEAATTRIEQQLDAQARNADAHAREWRDHVETVERIAERLADHESRIRVIESRRQR